jgi:hypothetical protein
MNRNIFENKIEEIEKVFNAKYADGQTSFLWKMIYKWRESTFLMVISSLCENFKPSYGVPLPLPAHFNEIRTQLNIQEEQEWKKQIIENESNDNPAYMEYKKQVSLLLKKWTGNEEFKLTTSHIDGKFACEICQREGCNGRTEKQMRLGCTGFLSEEAFNKIKEKHGSTIEKRIETLTK